MAWPERSSRFGESLDSPQLKLLISGSESVLGLDARRTHEESQPESESDDVVDRSLVLDARTAPFSVTSSERIAESGTTSFLRLRVFSA